MAKFAENSMVTCGQCLCSKCRDNKCLYVSGTCHFCQTICAFSGEAAIDTCDEWIPEDEPKNKVVIKDVTQTYQKKIEIDEKPHDDRLLVIEEGEVIEEDW